MTTDYLQVGEEEQCEDLQDQVGKSKREREEWKGYLVLILLWLYKQI